MISLIKQVARECTPPVMWRAARSAKRSFSRVKVGNQTFRYGSELPAEYYDESFRETEHWCHHYTESHYYPLWSVIADRIRRAGVTSIVDIGCGPGQVACLLRDKGIAHYCGLDFSPARIEQAKVVCPEYDFEVTDVFATSIFEEQNYDCVLILEFLEHVENDLEVLNRIKPGTLVVASVPNFPDPGHVRYFSDVYEVRERYQQQMSSIQVDEHSSNAKDCKFFLIEARK